LTIKFTRHTGRSSASRFSLVSNSLLAWIFQRAAQTPWRLFTHRTHIRSLGSRTPANIGTHKISLRLVICPIYSVVKYRPRPAGAGDVLNCFQFNVRRQATCIEP